MPTLQHSPAPWQAVKTDREFCIAIVDADGCKVAVLDASNEAWGGMDDDQFLTGDAAIVAAAPKMYELCRLLAERDNPDDPLVQDARGIVEACEKFAP